MAAEEGGFNGETSHAFGHWDTEMVVFNDHPSTVTVIKLLERMDSWQLTEAM